MGSKKHLTIFEYLDKLKASAYVDVMEKEILNVDVVTDLICDIMEEATKESVWISREV